MCSLKCFNYSYYVIIVLYLQQNFIFLFMYLHTNVINSNTLYIWFLLLNKYWRIVRLISANRHSMLNSRFELEFYPSLMSSPLFSYKHQGILKVRYHRNWIINETTLTLWRSGSEFKQKTELAQRLTPLSVRIETPTLDFVLKLYKIVCARWLLANIGLRYPTRPVAP